ncbi:helix-turn-helix domain-containing protein [Actinomadura nitritigenes]|uniref:helix-turn-helix domain-containing protein n=1 Tax=Actinomadura nitritigenes TaxID=134602 RepID=UPI003D8D2055
MSRSRPPAPLPDDLPDAVRVLLTELRGLKEASGHDLRALERRTHASRSSWSRWLGGETPIPRSAVTALARVCGADRHRLEALWEVADHARASASSATADAAPGAVSDTAPETADAAPETAEALPADEREPAGDTVGRPEPVAPTTPEEPLSEREPAPSPAARKRVPRGLLIGAAVGCTFVSGAAGVLLGTTLHTNAQEPASDGGRQAAAPARSTHAPARTVYRHDVIARAESWHPRTRQRVPYGQAASYQGYRADGSGYAAMALGLPAPGPNSASLLASYCDRVPPARLGAGDLVVNATGDAGTREVMIFDRWTGRARAAFWVYQQRRGYGTDHLVRPARLTGDGRHVACHPRGLRDDPVG